MINGFRKYKKVRHKEARKNNYRSLWFNFIGIYTKG